MACLCLGGKIGFCYLREGERATAGRAALVRVVFITGNSPESVFLPFGTNPVQVPFSQTHILKNKYNHGSKFLFSLKPGLTWVEALYSKKKVCYSPVAPRPPATGLTAGSIEPAASGSVTVNTSSQYLLPDLTAERSTKNTGILSKKLPLRLCECAL